MKPLPKNTDTLETEMELEAERQVIANHILNDMRLAGLKPDALGKSLMERVIKGEITNLQAIALLDEHYKRQQK